LWESLRELRKRLADEQGVPPYVIFHDRALLAMVEHRPANGSEFLAIDGVGEKKLDAYGSTFLSAIAAAAN
jgi:ATP-dependent DNA helicase RecQ